MKFISYKKCLLLSLLVSLNYVGCTKNGQSGETVIKFTYPKGETLAEVGGTSLSLEGFREDFLARQGTFKGAPHLNTDEKKKEFVNNEVLKEAMFQEAVKLGYFDDPALQRDIKKIVVQKLIQKTLETSQNEYKPAEAEMKAYYDSNQNLFSRKEALKVSYMYVPYGDNKAQAKKVADELYQDATKKGLNGNTNEFVKLALKYMVPNAANNVKVESGHTDFQEQAAFDTKFGTGTFEKLKQTEQLGIISSVIPADQGYVVIMKNGYRKDINETFDEAKEKIAKKLAFDNRGKIYEKYTEELKTKYGIKIYEDKIAKLSEGVEMKAQANNQVAPPAGMPPVLNNQVGGAAAGTMPPAGANQAAKPIMGANAGEKTQE